MAQLGALDCHLSTGSQKGASLRVNTNPGLEREQSQGPYWRLARTACACAEGAWRRPRELTNCRGLENRTVLSLEVETHPQSQ